MSSAAHESDQTVDGEWVRTHVDDPGVRIVEVDVSPAAYDEGHVPGAVLWNAYGDLRDAAYKPIGPEGLRQLLERSGVKPETTLVFYGYGAALGFWLMKAHGHDDVRMLVGPREVWEESGAWSADDPHPGEGSYPLPAEDPKLLASRAAIEAAIGDPGTILLDVRSPEEFSGERFWPSGATADAGRAGHLPGAISLPIDHLRDESGQPKGLEDLEQAVSGSGVSADKDVIIYCTIGNRASQAWYALSQLLGYPKARVYYGSWVEWGKEDDTPIET